MRFVKLLGRGASAKVYLAELVAPDGAVETIAVKRVQLQKSSRLKAAERAALKVLRLEAGMLRRLSHPNVVKYRGMHHSKRKHQFHILME